MNGELEKRTIDLPDGFKISLEWVYDENPDTSFLGEYSNTPAMYSIDREHRGDISGDNRYQYRYFNLGAGDPEYLEQDYQRMEAYGRQEWYFLGMVASVYGPEGIELGRASLWGIESDGDPDYFETVEEEEALEAMEAARARFGKLKSVFASLEFPANPERLEP